MRRWAMTGLVSSWLIPLSLLAAPQARQWYESYEEGTRLLREGRAADARAELEGALRKREQEGLRLPTADGRYVDYLPHLYLAIACHMAGDTEAALQHLTAAERSGVASESETGSRLLAAYRLLLTGTDAGLPEPPGATAPGEKPRYEVFGRKPPVIPEQEFKRIQDQVLARCHLSLGKPERAPWYYHYELGLELGRRGDNQRALDAFIDAAHRRPQSQRLARTYGVWFVDYLPYLQIAKAHARLGNRLCALDALSFSERLGELSEDERELVALRALLGAGDRTPH